MLPKAFEGEGGLIAVLRIRVFDQFWSEITSDKFPLDIWEDVSL